MKSFETRIDMLTAEIKPFARIAEIGVFAGAFSAQILKHCRPVELLLVDIWEGRHASGDKDGNNAYTIENMLDSYLDLCYRYRSHGAVRLIRSRSDDFFKMWPSNDVDVVYIDADHSYEGVTADLRGAFHITKPNGLIMGHDCHKGSSVERAVLDFCRMYQQEVEGMAHDGCPSFMIRLRK